ncbi:MAG: tRNA (adenine(22)-N(1))-methyltransferase TrmK, partial [Veillonella sp.]|nr:tRNA (adenine(22)-N(1))-methyltransferase TrmK [Veillonella sp.]
QPQNGQKELRQYMVQKGYVIVLEIIVEDAGKLYTAFLAVRNDQVEAYTGMTEYVDVYQSLPEDSLLWSVGALLEQERPSLWTKYIEYLIYQRQCALDGMTEQLSHTDKYKDLEREVEFLHGLLEDRKK